jgi:hypothetical protein
VGGFLPSIQYNLLNFPVPNPVESPQERLTLSYLNEERHVKNVRSSAPSELLRRIIIKKSIAGQMPFTQDRATIVPENNISKKQLNM